MTQHDGSKILVASSGFGGMQMLLAIVGGAVGGAVVALLLAPHSGAETRAKIRDLAEHARDQAVRLPHVIHEAGTAAKGAFNKEMKAQTKT